MYLTSNSAEIYDLRSAQIWKNIFLIKNKQKKKQLTFIMFAMCSAPRHVILQAVKSTVLILAEYFTLWQIAESIKKKNQQQIIFCLK